MAEGRVLGVDMGSRRIGLALSDESRTLASPLGVIKRTSNAETRASLAKIVEAHQVTEIVVGLPRSLSGEEGPQAGVVRRDCERLITPLGPPVRLWDERLSTFEAQRLRAEAGPRRGRARKDLDAAAAAVILQSYLDAREEPS